jgi:hypothetical protein
MASEWRTKVIQLGEAIVAFAATPVDQLRQADQTAVTKLLFDGIITPLRNAIVVSHSQLPATNIT